MAMKVWFFRFWLILSVLSWPAVGHAQQPPESQAPLMGSEALPSPSVPATDGSTGFGGADGIYRILVVGDNLAGGLGAGMSRMVQDDPRYEIVNRFNESSGLARTEFYDWPSAIEKIVADNPIDAVVVLLGVNDRQEIREGNARYPFKSPNWIKGYTANIDRLLAAAKAANAGIFWVSIPPMADPVFDADMRYVADLQSRQVVAAGGHVVDVRSAFLAPDGSYVDRGPDETGAERKLRSRDGITFYKQGNNRFGQLVMAEVNKLATGNAVIAPQDPSVVTSNVATAKTTIPAPASLGVTVVTEAPSFGQDGLDGEAISFKADAIQPTSPGPKSVAQRVVLENGVTRGDVKLTAKIGSEAQRLFVDGVLPAAPTGRFDDDMVPPLQ
jgi:uncharacterized protein